MPTGRPDYWYGTALYFDDSPGDGEVTRGPTCNWAYDHVNDASAHHAKAAAGDIDHGETTGLDDDDHSQYVHLSEDRIRTKKDQFDDVVWWAIFKEATVNKLGLVTSHVAGVGLAIYNYVTESYKFRITELGNIDIVGTVDGVDIAGHAADNAAHHAKYTDAEAVAAVKAIVDDSPVDGETDIPISSNWSYDHAINAAAHHAKYNPANEEIVLLGWGLGAPGDRDYTFFANGDEVLSAYLKRSSGEHGHFLMVNAGNGNLYFYAGGSARLAILATGGVDYIWDDTPTNGEVRKGVTSDWAFDHKADASAHHAPVAVFVDRGDPADSDYDQAALTVDGNYNDLDLSAIVPANAIAVLLRIKMADAVAIRWCYLRKNGNTNVWNMSTCKTQVNGEWATFDCIVPCDANRVIEYNITAGTAAFELTVGGWWI